MANWIEYTGSDEQIREIKANTHGYMVRNIPPITGFIFSPRIRYDFELSGRSEVKFEYLICQPHPYADLIKIWARTGCEVYIRITYQGSKDEFPELAEHIISVEHIETYCTNEPDWNIPGAEYSLTPFED